MAGTIPSVPTRLRHVSTADQNFDLQHDALKRAGCVRIFEDKASGSRTDRPGLADALSHLREGDILVVWKLDRLGRTVHQLVEFVATLQSRSVEFKSLSDSTDTSAPAGRFFFHMMAALAEMERDLIRERTNAGLAAAKARGRQGGHRPKLSAQQLAHARRLLQDPGTTACEIADTLGVARSTLYRARATEKKR